MGEESVLEQVADSLGDCSEGRSAVDFCILKFSEVTVIQKTKFSNFRFEALGVIVKIT